MNSIDCRLKTPAHMLLQYHHHVVHQREYLDAEENNNYNKIGYDSNNLNSLNRKAMNTKSFINDSCRLFEHTGMLVLEDVLSKDTIKECQTHCKNIMDCLQHAFQTNKKIELTQPFKFKEVSRRQYNRYDVNTDLVFQYLYGKDHVDAKGLYDKVFDVMISPWMPLVKAILKCGQEYGNDDDFYIFRKGVVFNEAGSTTQPFHSDGKHLFPKEFNIQAPCHCVHLFSRWFL